MTEIQSPDHLSLRPIGIVRSRFKSMVGMPIQTVAAAEVPAEVHVFEEFAAGLRDIEPFEYLILITHLHQAAQRLEVVPFMDTQSRGVFATRSPARPNRLGLSIVRLMSVQGNLLAIQGNDMLDGTPVLDIKPYIPALDVRATERIGWFRQGLEKLPSTVSDDRMR